jgi:Arc/MetJ-type ribon-helix-helix transcriptional regulator
MDGGGMMAGKVVQLRDRVPDSEKVTINLGYVDLGRIDLLVQEGFFSNRTDFIRSAIRNELGRQSAEVSRSIERHMLELGLLELGVTELEAALEAIGSLTVLGALQASPQVKAALAARTK